LYPGDDDEEFAHFPASEAEEDRTVTTTPPTRTCRTTPRLSPDMLDDTKASQHVGFLDLPLQILHPRPGRSFTPTNVCCSSPFQCVSMPNSFRTFPSSALLIYASTSHPRPILTFVLLRPSPPTHKEWERGRPMKESRPLVERSSWVILRTRSRTCSLMVKPKGLLR
jgi:hypothetical protein